MLEVWLLIGAVWLTVRLVRQKDHPSGTGRTLGQALVLIFTLLSAVTFGLSIVVAVISTVINWIV